MGIAAENCCFKEDGRDCSIVTAVGAAGPKSTPCQGPDYGGAHQIAVCHVSAGTDRLAQERRADLATRALGISRN
jgi:hypothetical protein